MRPEPDSPHRETPPRAPLSFRVGVVGHRPNRLKGAELALLAERLHEVLDQVGSAVRELQRTPRRSVRTPRRPCGR